MGKGKKIIMILFFMLFAFILGCIFLFFVSVPVESALKEAQASQKLVNASMIAIIVLWGGASIFVTRLFNKRFVHGRKIGKAAISILTILFLSCCAIFYILLTTDNPIMASLRGGVDELNDSFTFGPYPEEARLKELKSMGYTGVVTLLSPTIPFEDVLLEKEINTGKSIGLKVYSFPMLPWISENEESINGIKELLKDSLKQKGSKFYVHCYLGKHRAVMVKELIEASFNSEALSSVSIYPHSLERGSLIYYKDSTVILGPYPTDEEWFTYVLRGETKEVVSILDPLKEGDAKLIDKEKKACEEMGLKFTNIPVRKVNGSFEGLEDLDKYILSLKERVFIHGYSMDDRMSKVDEIMKAHFINFSDDTLSEKIMNARIYGIEESSLPEEIGDMKPITISKKLIMGALPKGEEYKLLHSMGINTVILLTGRDKKTNEEIELIKNDAENEKMSFLTVDYGKDYITLINEQIIKDINPCYLIVPLPSMHQVESQIRKTKIKSAP